MRKLVILLSCLVCLTAAGRLGLERKLLWLQDLQHTMGQDNKMVTANQIPVVNQRQEFLLDVLLQMQKPLLNAELIEMGKTLNNQPEMYLEIDDDLLLFLEQCRQHEILGRNEVYSDLNIQHARQLLGLYKFLVLARDWTTFQRNVCFARLHINPLMLVNALQMAIRVRADTQELIMPALNEIMPQLFYDRDVIAAAQNVDWLNLINGKPIATARPTLVDVLGLRGLGMGLASKAAGLWRPWQQWRMQMLNEKAAMRNNIMGMNLGVKSLPAFVSGGRSVIAEEDENKVVIVVPVERTLTEVPSLTEDADLNIFWNNVMTERLMQTMSNGKQQKPTSGKMWNINNRMTDVGDMTLDEVLRIQQLHQQGITKRRTPEVWSERQGNVENNEDMEMEENWPTEEDIEDNILSRSSGLWGKLPIQNNKEKVTPIQTLDNLPVSDVSNPRLLHVNRRRMKPISVTRMMDNAWNRKIDDESRQNQDRQGIWERPIQDDDIADTIMEPNRQGNVSPMRQSHWSHIGNGRMVADSDERRNHGRKSTDQDQEEINLTERLLRPRAEQDNDENRHNRWNSRLRTQDQEQINSIGKFLRPRAEQDNDANRHNRFISRLGTQDQEQINSIERMQRLREELNTKEQTPRMQDRWNDAHLAEDNEQLGFIERMLRLGAEQDNDEDRIDRLNIGRRTQDQEQVNSIERMQYLRSAQDTNKVINQRDNVQRWGRIIERADNNNDDDQPQQQPQWRTSENNDMWMNTATRGHQTRNTNADNDQRRNINRSNSRRAEIVDGDRLMNRRTNDDDTWVRHPRSAALNTMNKVMITPADELMTMRSGEIFIQNLQQMLARINMDKLALTLNGVQVDDSVNPPRLLTTSGVSYQQRAINEIDAKRSVRQVMQGLKSIIDLVLEHQQVDKRSGGDDMMQIIGDILIERIDGQEDGAAANVWDALYTQVNRDVYGLETGQVNTATVLSTPTGNLREPIYQVIVNELMQLINEYKANLRPYTVEELDAPGVTVNDIDIDRLVTYTEFIDTDLINLVDQQLLQSNANNLPKLQKRVVARQQRLNHQPFTMTLDIESERSQRVVVRTFLGPQIDVAGRPYRNVNENRQNFVQLDAFVKNLERGTNVFQRQSRDITWTSRDVSTLSEIYNRVMTGQSLLQLQGSNCRFPQHLLIPRGTVDALAMQLFVIITPVSEEDRVLEQLVQAERLCGLGNAAMHLDRRPLGFPFDRPIVPRSLSNILLKDIVIEHDSRVRGGRV